MAASPRKTNASIAADLIEALDRDLHDGSPEDRTEWKASLERKGAPVITATSLRTLVQALRVNPTGPLQGGAD